jgi:polar amino acid transport system ATP-binding protein
MSEPIVRFENVSKRFGETVVMRDFDLDIAPNEKLAVIGPSGSGKSTLLRLLMTLEQPDDGVIYVKGEPLHHMWKNGRLVPADQKHLRKVRGHISMVFQHFHLFPHMTAIGNVIEGPIHVLGMKRAEAVARAEGLLDMVGLADKKNSHPSQLSGGQQQRVAIARALAMQPDVMLFDEVTSALDPELVGEVLNAIRKIGREQDITMILVTHEMGFAKEFADRVIFIEGGRIVEQGPGAQVLSEPRNERTQAFLRAVLG